MLKTPILFLIFNRPETTGIVFEEIRKQKPTHLFVAADGARVNKKDEFENCEAVRRLATNVDWPCEVKTLFRENNLGCKRAVQEAIDWFFSYVDEGIILEDDILPNEQFFSYCSYMLDKYRNDENILSVNGCNLGYQNSQYDYGFTRYFNMWGWATWKRSNQKVSSTWKLYCENPNILKDQTVTEALRLPIIFGNNRWRKKWQNIFLKTANGITDTWDYQWVYTAFKTKSFCIRPNQNMVLNLGFSSNATHTKNLDSVLSNMKYGQDFNNSPMLRQDKIDKMYEVDFVAKKWNGFYPFRQTIMGRLIYKFLYLSRIIKEK